MYSSPAVPEPLFVLNELTVPWTSPGNKSFQMLIEGAVGGGEVSLTTIDGFFRPLPEISGCAYFAHVQNADVRSPETRTP
jgi:hypothetical protein